MHKTAAHPNALVYGKSVAHQVAECEEPVFSLGQWFEDVGGGVADFGPGLIDASADA